MRTGKLGRAKSFRPRPQTEKRLEYARSLGLDVSELINDVLDLHLKDRLVRQIEESRVDLIRRQERLSKALAAPVP